MARSRSRRGSPARRVVVVGIGVLMVALIAIDLDKDLGRSASPTISGSNPVQPVSRTVPQKVARIPLVDQFGHLTNLAAFHGRVVVLADFMTSCQEECPITTGALLSVEVALHLADLQGRVAVVEASVDPWRDVPSRLLAYSKTFGIPWTLLTGSSADLAHLWSFFGVYYERVKEGTPPDINWQNGKPYSFDIVHSDDVFVLGAAGDELALVDGDANVGGRLPKGLARLLSSTGRQELMDPGLGSWTPEDMLQAIGSVIGEKIPLPGR